MFFWQHAFRPLFSNFPSKKTICSTCQIVKFYTLVLDPENRTLFSGAYTDQITECSAPPSLPTPWHEILFTCNWLTNGQWIVQFIIPCPSLKILKTLHEWFQYVCCQSGDLEVSDKSLWRWSQGTLKWWANSFQGTDQMSHPGFLYNK